MIQQQLLQVLREQQAQNLELSLNPKKVPAMVAARAQTILRVEWRKANADGKHFLPQFHLATNNIRTGSTEAISLHEMRIMVMREMGHDSAGPSSSGFAALLPDRTVGGRAMDAGKPQNIRTIGGVHGTTLNQATWDNLIQLMSAHLELPKAKAEFCHKYMTSGICNDNCHRLHAFGNKGIRAKKIAFGDGGEKAAWKAAGATDNKPRGNRNNRQNSGGRQRNRTRDRGNRNRRNTNNNNNNGSSQRLCWVCGDPGHGARNCPRRFQTTAAVSTATPTTATATTAALAPSTAAASSTTSTVSTGRRKTTKKKRTKSKKKKAKPGTRPLPPRRVYPRNFALGHISALTGRLGFPVRRYFPLATPQHPLRDRQGSSGPERVLTDDDPCFVLGKAPAAAWTDPTELSTAATRVQTANRNQIHRLISRYLGGRFPALPLHLKKVGSTITIPAAVAAGIANLDADDTQIEEVDAAAEETARYAELMHCINDTTDIRGSLPPLDGDLPRFRSQPLNHGRRERLLEVMALQPSLESSSDSDGFSSSSTDDGGVFEGSDSTTTISINNNMQMQRDKHCTDEKKQDVGTPLGTSQTAGTKHTGTSTKGDTANAEGKTRRIKVDETVSIHPFRSNTPTATPLDTSVVRT